MGMVPILEMMRIKYPDVDSLEKPWEEYVLWGARPYVTLSWIIAVLLGLHAVAYQIWKNNPFLVRRRASSAHRKI